MTTRAQWLLLLLIRAAAAAAATGRGGAAAQHAHRCAGARGAWCGPFFEQQPVPRRAPPALDAPCPGGCSGVGVCHGDTGACHCPAGWGGPDCAAPLKRPCTRGYRSPRNSTAPSSHIGPDGRDLDWHAKGSTYSRCAGICDEDIAACYCDPKLGDPKYGRVPAPPGSPPGTPPVQAGRPLFEPCSRLADDGRGGKLVWVDWAVAYDKVYGPQGWCVADEPQVPECRCDLDGSGGPGCNLPSEMFCPNQCSGRGACRLGFCHCHAGWWGLDCAHAATEQAAAAPAPQLAPWLREVTVDAWRCAGGGGGCLEEAVGRVDAEPWPAGVGGGGSSAVASSTSSSGGGPAGGGGGDSAEAEAAERSGAAADYREAAGGVPPPGQQRRRAALRAARLRALRRLRALLASNSTDDSGGGGTARQADAAPGRLRPLIYVYDVPSIYVGRMLQYRMYKESCTWRWFDAEYDNATLTSPYPYGSEPLLLELLLMSGHRTLDPAEADFFYVPLMATCWMHPVSGWADYPWWYVDTWSRVSHAVMMTHELLGWVKSTYPYWNRTGGADHIWLFAHDEGACWAPSEVYERGIILTHWGRLDRDHTSGTSYGQDNYTADVTDDPFNPAGYTRLIRGHPCYTPGKDLVLPLFRGPHRYHASPYLGAPQRPRDILLFHRGRMGLAEPPSFSRGVRQQVARLAKEQRWRERFNISVGGYDEVPGDYSELLARSVFCLVAAGDGWSARFDDAMLHGCIPVIVMDRVVGPWGHQLRWRSFSVRVAEAEVDRLPQILLDFTPDHIARMQRAGAAVWRRFAWLSHPVLLRSAKDAAAANAAKRQAAANSSGAAVGSLGAAGSSGAPLSQAQLGPGQWRDDAFGTLMQWLYHKLQQRQAAAAAPAGGGGGGAPTELPGPRDAGHARRRRRGRRRHGRPGVAASSQPGGPGGQV